MSTAGNVAPEEVQFEGIHGTLTIRRPAAQVVLAVFNGPDVGEFGERPFTELAKDLAQSLPPELFIDARECVGASVNVSNEWAQWMIANRTHLYRVHLLCGSRYVEVTANFVRRFTDFGQRMRIYTDRDAFYDALSVAAGV